MKKNSICIILILVSTFSIFSQKKEFNPFKRVNVPDSIFMKLEESYKKNAINVNAGRNVINLINRKSFEFKDGIYSFSGQGPHYPRRIFIYNSGKIFIFENEGALNPIGILKEYLICTENLKLKKSQITKYLKVISEYLMEEYRMTYGTEIIN